MTWRSPGRDLLFKEKVRYEDKFMEQIGHCMTAFNMNDAHLIAYTVDTLHMMITHKMQDARFRGEIEDLEDKREVDLMEKQDSFEDEKSVAMCPDVVEDPSEIPDIVHNRMKLMICLNLLERKGMLLKEKTIGFV